MLLAPRLLGQIDMGRIVGTVMDQSGAVVPDAKVTLTDEGTGLVLETASGDSGMYIFTALKLGTYGLAVERTGFKKFVRAGLPVHVQQSLTVDIVLTPGEVMETIKVTAAAPVLQVENAALGQITSSRLLMDLPISGRSFSNLAQISVGVVSGSEGYVANGGHYTQNDFRLNGIDNNVEVFGDTAAISLPPEALEEFKLQTGNYSAEFGHSGSSVLNATTKSGTNQVHGYLWEYLQNDKLNATAFFLNATGSKKTPLRQNQFGGAIGGPIVLPKVYNGRNRAFFFFDYQGTHTRSRSQLLSTVPTQAMVQSGYTNLQDLITYQSGTRTDALGRVFPLGTVFDPATTRSITAGVVDPVTGLKAPSSAVVRDPFFTGSLVGLTNFTVPGIASMLNILPANRLDANAMRLLGLYPAANLSGFTNDFTYNSPAKTTSNLYNTKIDYNFSPTDQLFGTFTWTGSLGRGAQQLPGIADGQSGAVEISSLVNLAVALSYTHMFSPTMANEARLGYFREPTLRLATYGDQLGIPASYGIGGIPQFPNNGGLPTIGITGLTGLGLTGSVPTIQIVQSKEFTDNFTKVLNNHMMKAGLMIEDLRAGITQPSYSHGRFVFSGTYTSVANVGGGGTGIAQLLLTPIAATVPNGYDFVGGADTVGASTFANVDYERYYTGFYYQDDWKVTPKLTLNLGLRWDYFQPDHSPYGAMANFQQNGTILIPQSRCHDPVSASFTALTQKDGMTVQCSNNPSLAEAQRTNFAPRVGFAYRLSSRLVVRGGYGLSYGALNNLGFSPTLGVNYPFQFNLAYNAPDTAHPITYGNGSIATLENGLSAIALNATSVNAAGLTLYGRQYHFKTPNYQSLNFTTEFQVSANQSLELRWVGTLGRDLDDGVGLNLANIMLPPSANPQLYVPFPDFARGGTFEDTAATSHYHALQAEFQRRFSGGLTLLGNYAYQQCRSDYRALIGNQLGSYRAPYLASFGGIHGDYALCDFDIRHVTHVAGVYELPIGNGKSVLRGGGKLVQGAVGGWRLSYVLTLNGGKPFTVGCPVSTSAGFGCNAFMVPGQDVYAGGHTVAHWLNAAAFAQPPIATAIGQTNLSPLGGAPTQARAPGVQNLDLSLFKAFALKERIRLEFRADAYGSTNTPHFGTPGSLDFTNTKLFAQITSASGQRTMQLAMRLAW